jgi:hypothetical protein
LLEEANRQKQRLQELGERSTQAINIEVGVAVVLNHLPGGCCAHPLDLRST